MHRRSANSLIYIIPITILLLVMCALLAKAQAPNSSPSQEPMQIAKQDNSSDLVAHKDLIWAMVGVALGALGSALITWYTTKKTVEHQKNIWIREKLLEAYSQCIYYLFKLEISSTTHPITNKDVRQHLSEAQRYLLLLSAYQTSKNAKDKLIDTLGEIEKAIGADKNNANAAPTISKKAKLGYSAVKQLLDEDSRVKETDSITKQPEGG